MAELEGWLRERGVAEEELAVVVDGLIEAGALDDRRFALRFAEDKRQLRGWGPDRISAALLDRGVSPEHVEAAARTEGARDQVGRAAGILRGRAIAVGSERDRGRALAMLVRRGFPLEVAYEAVRDRERDTA